MILYFSQSPTTFINVKKIAPPKINRFPHAHDELPVCIVYN